MITGAADDLVTRSGRYIELTTDLSSAAETETLVASFDAAVGQWVEFWELSDDALADWKVKAYIIRDKERFRRQGLIPNHIPDFPFGYAHGNTVWVLAQQSEYYTRHLLLHEGVHSLAFFHFGGAGPTWFMEGTAEMLAVHRGQGAATKINQIPRNRTDVPYWGRFKLIKELRKEGRVPTIETVMRYRPTLTGNVETYGWSWAAAMLFHAYPEYHEAFFAAAKNGSDGPDFNQQLYRQIGQRKWPVVAARWRVMCDDLDYGFDWSHQRLAISENDPPWDGKTIDAMIDARRGWQSTGVRFAPGTKLTLQGTGEVILDTQPKPWISQPPGVTIKYHRGRPLGQLLACVLPNATPRGQRLAPLKIFSVEKETEIQIDQHCWLLFRVNDAVDARGNNQGAYQLTIR